MRGIADHNGYVDLSGFTGVQSGVNSTPTHGIDLAGGSGFASYGVVEDDNIITNTFITGDGTSERIFAAGVYNAAQEVAANFTDTGTNKGFVTVWDNNSDYALFQVDHNFATHGSTIGLDEIKLVGVFDTIAAMAPVIAT